MEKLERFIEMLEQPDRYSEEQWQEQFDDPELRTSYELLLQLDRAAPSVAGRQSTAPSMIADRPAARREPKGWGRGCAMWRRLAVAAVVAGVLLMSGIAYAVIRHASSRKVVETSSVASRPVPSGDEAAAPAANLAPPPPHTFENESLEDILAELAAYYHVRVVYENDASRRLRLFITWDPSLPLGDVVALFNHFEKVNLSFDRQTIVVK